MDHVMLHKADGADLRQCRGSKHGQSGLAGILPQIRQAFIRGETVCFFGTPCQVTGLFYPMKKPAVVIRFCIATVLVSVLLKFTGLGYASLFIGLCMGSLVQVLLLERRLQLLKAFSMDGVSARTCLQMLKFSLPLSLSTIGYWFFSSYNRTVIVQRLSEEANGNFAVAAKFGLVISFASMCFTRAWQEFSFSRSDTSESTSRVYSNISRKYFHFLVLGFGLLTVGVKLVFPYIVNESYTLAMYLVPIVMFANVLDAFHAFLAGIVNTYRKSHLVFISMLCGCAVNIIAIQMLIGRIGVYAGGCSMILGYAVSIMIRMGIIRKIIKYRPKINWIVAAMVVVESFANYWFGNWITSCALAVMLLVLGWLEFGTLIKRLSVKPEG